MLVAQLDRIIKRLVDALPQTLEKWRRGVDLRSMKDVRVDHLGSVGTRLMLEKVNIASPDKEFTTRASATFPRGPSGDFSRQRGSAPRQADNAPQQRRIFAYAEYRFEGPAFDDGQVPQPVAGRMLREHGFQGLRMWQKGWLKAVTLPVNPHVDRSVCAEFSVFNELCDLVHQNGLADNVYECNKISGEVSVLVSTTPCLSCVCCVMQYSLIFPQVRLEFGCVQPWHSFGGADGAMQEPAWTGKDDEVSPILPAVWEGGQIVSGGDRVDGGRQRLAKAEVMEETDEPLIAGELEVLQAACYVKLGGGHAAGVHLGEARNWADVRRALEQTAFSSLADVLRGHRKAVQGETLPVRVQKVLAILRQQRDKNPAPPESFRRPLPRSASLSVRRASSQKRDVVRWRVGP